MLFSSKPKYLIAGLGNPGITYENTRHNAGFICADSLVDYYDASPVKTKANALVYKAVKSEFEMYIIKPQTYMNLSGEAVRDVMQFYKIPKENIIVIFDDTSLDAGKIRIRPKGSDGGQRGMRSIIEQLGFSDIMRIKIGVGKKPNPEYDMKDWVLSKLDKDSLEKVQTAAKKTGDICNLLVKGELDKARNMYNG